MDVALPVEMLLLDPERALHAAVFVHPAPKRTYGFSKLSRVQVCQPFNSPSVSTCRSAGAEQHFGGVRSLKMAFNWMFPLLKSDREGCANAIEAPPGSSGQAANAP